MVQFTPPQMQQAGQLVQLLLAPVDKRFNHRFGKHISGAFPMQVIMYALVKKVFLIASCPSQSHQNVLALCDSVGSSEVWVGCAICWRKYKNPEMLMLASHGETCLNPPLQTLCPVSLSVDFDLKVCLCLQGQQVAPLALPPPTNVPTG